MAGPIGGPSTIHVDDTSSLTFDATNGHLTPQTPFYQETGPGPRPHDNLARVVDPQFNDGQEFKPRINCAVLRRSPPTDDDLPSSPPSSSSLSGGAIGGIVACVVLSIFLILLGVFIWHRRERKQGDSSAINKKDEDIQISEIERSFGTGPVVHHTPSLPALPPLRIPSPSNSVMVSVSPIESDSDVDEGPIFTFSSQDSRTGSDPHSDRADRPPEFVVRGLGKVKREQGLAVVPSLLYPPVMGFEGDPGEWRQSLRPLPRPRIPSSDSLQYRSSLPDFRHMRMHVHGRLQDFGPATGPGSFFTISNPDIPPDEGDELLPPDYHQATQPFPDTMSAPVPISPSSGPLSPSEH